MARLQHIILHQQIHDTPKNLTRLIEFKQDRCVRQYVFQGDNTVVCFDCVCACERSALTRTINTAYSGRMTTGVFIQGALVCDRELAGRPACGVTVTSSANRQQRRRSPL